MSLPSWLRIPSPRGLGYWALELVLTQRMVTFPVEKQEFPRVETQKGLVLTRLPPLPISASEQASFRILLRLLRPLLSSG